MVFAAVRKFTIFLFLGEAPRGCERANRQPTEGGCACARTAKGGLPSAGSLPL
jgi:hypothetical protein